MTTSPTFELYLAGNEDGEVELICTHPGCMKTGRTTHHNPRGLWLQDVGHLPYHPSADQVSEAWRTHLAEHHDGKLPPNWQEIV